MSFVSGGGINQDKRILFCPVGGSTRDKRPNPFVPVGASTRDKRPLSSLLARLAVGLGTKATFYPEPKDSRDKWPGTKVCSVVVNHFKV